ncbi:alpha/beta family hydrolase [Catellatospora coxensis]|uniref:Alpha/beta hydrolase n=1 Tax=Catellatospora coxensis TaxID=310354 RepID=A0A8J3LEX8_9ACTN|nr:alpha/beta family hydrolase [Catellatospora coxensis]GIG11460.1 alpha/beta hydrolase [Catellatospora coxensis]
MRGVTETVETGRGPAQVAVTVPGEVAGRRAGAAAPVALLVLGHGAGGSVDAPDLTAVHDGAVAAGLVVALVTQPYRVAGRRAPAPAGHLDEAWRAVLPTLTERFPGLPLIVGGRSSGARVACRTAGEVGAAGIVALAFPLHPPGKPERSRAEELRTGLPTLVVNGSADPFGVPDAAPGVELVVLEGERHDLRRAPDAVGRAVVTWLRARGWAR